MARAWGDSGYYSDRGELRHGDSFVRGHDTAEDHFRGEKIKKNLLRAKQRGINRKNCTEDKRETCDQITDKLCTGDCPTGDV